MTAEQIYPSVKLLIQQVQDSSERKKLESMILGAVEGFEAEIIKEIEYNDYSLIDGTLESAELILLKEPSIKIDLQDNKAYLFINDEQVCQLNTAEKLKWFEIAEKMFSVDFSEKIEDAKNEYYGDDDGYADILSELERHN